MRSPALRNKEQCNNDHLSHDRNHDILRDANTHPHTMTQTQWITQCLFASHRNNLIVNSISGKTGWSLNCPLSFLQEIGILLNIEFSCRKIKLYFLHIGGGSLSFFPSILISTLGFYTFHSKMGQS